METKKRVNMTIYRPLNKTELNEIYTKVKKAFGRRGKQLISKKHIRLYTLVEKHGGVPKRNKTEFWEKILKEWNNMYPKPIDKYKGPNCVRITYQRSKRYLEEKVTEDNLKF